MWEHITWGTCWLLEEMSQIESDCCSACFFLLILFQESITALFYTASSQIILTSLPTRLPATYFPMRWVCLHFSLHWSSYKRRKLSPQGAALCQTKLAVCNNWFSKHYWGLHRTSSSGFTYKPHKQRRVHFFKRCFFYNCTIKNEHVILTLSNN